MQFLKQSTVASVVVGPVLDSTGAAYTSAVIGDFNITKNGTTAAMAATATATHDHNGIYIIALTTGNTDTLGRLDISCNKATYAMTVFRYIVLTSTTFDAIITNAANAAGGLLDIQRMAGTALTGRDIGASVLLSNGTGTGQVKLSSGYISPNWGDVGNPTTTVALTGTTIADTQKVDINTIKTNPVVNAGTVTFPTGATLASTTNITAGTITTVTNLTNAPTNGDFTSTMKTSITTAATAATPSVTVSTNNDKTGYTLTQAFPTNFSSLSISTTTGLVDITQTAADKVWGSSSRTLSSFGTLVADIWSYATRVLTAGTNIVLAKGTGITGFNDIAATAIVSGGAINTSAGAVSNVTTTTNLTNAPTSGDFTATMKTSITTAASSATPVVTISGTITTLDALNTSLNSAHGSGSWATVTEASIRNAVGLGVANLDTQLNAIYTVAGLVQAKTDNLPSDPADESLIIAATDAIMTRLGTSVNAATIAGAVDVAISEANSAHNIVADATSGNPALYTIVSGLSTFDVNSDVVLANVVELNSIQGAAEILSAIYNSFENGMATSGGTSSITLRGDGSSVNDYYKDQAILLLSGAGAVQTNRITAYNGTTKIATVKTPWTVQPDNTTKYVVLGRIG